MLSSEINVRSECKGPSVMGIQNRKRKEVVSLSLSVPAPKRLFLSSLNDDLDAFQEGVLCSVCSETGKQDQCLHQRDVTGTVTIHRRLSDSSVESRGSLSADSGVEIDNTIGSNRSPCTPGSCTKQTEQNAIIVKRTQLPWRFEAELAQDDGYVRRMASLNAQACVSALLASKPKLQLKCLSGSYTMNVVGTKEDLHDSAQNCAQVEKLCHSEPMMDSMNDQHSVGCEKDIHQTIERWRAHQSTCGCDHPPITLPPAVVPSRIKNVVEVVEQLKAAPNVPLMKPKRGDNRWSCYGDPIRELRYHHPETNDCVERKYYVGIKRKQEEIFVRDCILVKGSSKKKPYIAKVASFWQEKGGLMMTLFWYYRPDDVQGLCLADFVEEELLASEHHDENTVACIEEKCYVVGMSQYCRFKAARRREEDSLGLPGVSSILHKGIEDTSFNDHWLPAIDTDPSLVFLCHRGYNHVTGRLLKLSPSK